MKSKQSLYKIPPGNFKEFVQVPTSKSVSNRLLILAAITPGEVTINDLGDSTDVNTLLRLLEELGLVISRDKNQVVIKNSFPDCEEVTDQPIRLETGDGGTTNRFLSQLLALGKNKYQLISTEKFKERPNQIAVDLIKSCDGNARLGEESEDFWIELQGPIKEGGEVEVDCRFTTQYLTAWLILQSRLAIKISSKNLHASSDYVEMTKSLVKQLKDGEKEFTVPIDFSSASYPVVFASCLGSVTIKGCFGVDPYQPDGAVIKYVEQMGAKVSWEVEGLHIESRKLQPLDVSCSAHPDLVPSLVFLALFADGETKLRDLGVLEFKESNRVAEICKILDKIEANYDYDNLSKQLTIYGAFKGSKKFEFNLPADHRMIMLASMICRAFKGGTVDNAHHVAKSYQGFFQDLLSK